MPFEPDSRRGDAEYPSVPISRHSAGERLGDYAEQPHAGPPPAPSPTEAPDSLLHIIIGPPQAVDLCRLELHHLGYAEAGAWSHPMKTVNLDTVLRTRHPNEVMRILGKRLAGTQGASPERSQ